MLSQNFTNRQITPETSGPAQTSVAQAIAELQQNLPGAMALATEI